jgi:hypothetical protein
MSELPNEPFTNNPQTAEELMDYVKRSVFDLLNSPEPAFDFDREREMYIKLYTPFIAKHYPPPQFEVRFPEPTEEDRQKCVMRVEVVRLTQTITITLPA